MNVDDAADGVQDDSISEKASSEDYTSRKMKEKNSSHQAAVDTPEQKKVREQIEYHDNIIIQLRLALNSQRPTIAKLPPEILAEIFLHQAAIVQRERIALHKEQGAAGTHKSFYEWARVAQVCHHWRDVALQCPRLWTWLAFEEHVSSRLTDTIAGRSHELPLTIVLAIDSLMMHCEVCLDPDRQCQYPGIAFWMVNQKLPRVRDLVIFIDREMDRMFGTVLDIWDPILETPAPLLEKLRIEATGSTRHTQEDSSEPAELNVRRGLFADQTPRLGSLTLGGVGVRFTNPLFCSTLRRLKIEDCQCWRPNTQPNFNAWLLTLKRLTHLEDLEVDWSIPSANEEIEYQPISAPKLKHLHLKTTVAVFADHMKYVKLPRSAAVHFSCTDANLLDQARMSSLRNAMSSLFDQMSVYCVSYGTIHPQRNDPGDSQRVQSPSCQFWGSDKSSIKPSTESPTSPPSPPQGPPPRLTFGSKLNTLDVPLIFAVIDLSHVHTVHVADFPSGNEWARVLKNTSNVTTLYAHGVAAFGLPAVLAGGVADNPNPEFLSGGPMKPPDRWFWTAFNANDGKGDEDRGTWNAPSAEERTASLFPSLRALTFISVDFLLAADAHRVSDDDLLAFDERGVEYGFAVETLVKSLHVRRAQGAGDITSVEFVNCLCPDMAQLASLVVTVPEVKWDGKRVDPARLSS